MLHKQFRGADRGCSRGERISKKGRKEKIDFQVHPSGVAQDGEIAFLYTAAVAGEAGDGHGFKSRSLYFGMG